MITHNVLAETETELEEKIREFMILGWAEIARIQNQVGNWQALLKLDWRHS